LAEERCVFVVDSGFVGSGPLSMKIGDEVFLLLGVPVPMVLYREERNRVLMVRGAALVHGLMHAEDSTAKKFEEITLV